MRPVQFNSVRSLHPGRSAFDLSYQKKLTCDMGQLVPVMCDEVVPGDRFIIGNRALTRMMPLVAPVMHEINMYVHYFFVPYRLLNEDFEDFITGGIDGDDTTSLDLWIYDANNHPVDLPYSSNLIWDYMGMPMNAGAPVACSGVRPMSFPRDAYNLVYNEYYRDETLQEEVGLNNEYILYRNWEKDYFTSALLWQQRGTAPALPITGTVHPDFTDAVHAVNQPGGAPVSDWSVAVDATNDLLFTNSSPATGVYNAHIIDALNKADIDLSGATTFDVADLRNAFQIQRWMERNARAGARYIESLQSHFGVSPRDERLQRPEYIGGSRVPLIISEVLQTAPATSTENTPQGTMSGHGITVSDAFCGKYTAQEYGLIIGIMSIMPRLSYSSQGVNRQWLRRTRYEFYWPEFAHLSEQEIYQGEINVSANSVFNLTPIGFQGKYDEMRVKQNMVVGKMRDDFDFWHLSRQFTFATATPLNETFVCCEGDSAELKRIFAVTDEPGFFVDFANIIKAIRPIPFIAEPGLIDHD